MTRRLPAAFGARTRTSVSSMKSGIFFTYHPWQTNCPNGSGASAHLPTTMAANRLSLGGTEGLRWAKGYSAQSVSWRALDAVREYVLNQERRHPHEAIDGWVPSPRTFQPPAG